MGESEERDGYDLNRLFLPVGTVLRGKYRIDGVIGRGGMAVVYAATHRNRKRFAVKALRPELSTRRDIRARFVREGYVANSVGHPGVVAVLDDDVTEDGLAFLVMELLEGATVEALSPRSKPLPLRESLCIAHAMLDVLAAAHAQDVVHRDIKPANIFVTRSGQIKVLDFGIARLKDATSGLQATGTGATLGTPAFMAPEQALALANEVDARTDLWAVGATLFTMLSGCLVHTGQSARQVMVRAATQHARSLASVAPDIPAAVVEWVSRALLFDKAARWESAVAMRDSLLELHGELFGPLQESCVSGLFDTYIADIESSPTEPSPTSALSSAVHETTRATPAAGFRVRADMRPSIPALPLDPRPEKSPMPRLPLALLALLLSALAVGIGSRFRHPARPLEVSLSAARSTTVSPASGAPVTADQCSPVAQAPANAFPETVHEARLTEQTVAAPAPRASALSTLAASPHRASPALPRALAPTPHAGFKTPASTARTAPERASAVAAASARNPLELDLQ